MRDREPNWKLAFGSGSFLIVWLLGIAANVPLDVVLFRSAMAAAMGTVLGTVVGMTLRGLVNLAKEPPKGGKVDFTVPASLDELATPPAPAADEASRVVPQAPAAMENFQPIDYKQAAKQVQGLVNE